MWAIANKEGATYGLYQPFKDRAQVIIIPLIQPDGPLALLLTVIGKQEVTSVLEMGLVDLFDGTIGDLQGLLYDQGLVSSNKASPPHLGQP
jgi:hypothetical protein